MLVVATVADLDALAVCVGLGDVIVACEDGVETAKACSRAAIWSPGLSSKATEVTATQALKAFFIAAAVRAGRRSQEGAGGAQGASGLLTAPNLWQLSLKAQSAKIISGPKGQLRRQPPAGG